MLINCDRGGGTYVAQLHQVFSGCDASGTGLLGRPELSELCAQLHLDDQSSLILGHLLGDDPEAKVDFDEFKEKFVYLLAQKDAAEDLADDDSVHFSSQDREVSPKYVWGNKKYGRRSRPDIDSNDTDNDLLSDFSDSEVFVRSVVPADGPDRRANVEVGDPAAAIAPRPRTVSSSHGGKTGAKRRRRMRSSDDRDTSTDATCATDLVTDSDEGGEENEEEYLRSIWLKLGVGTDGYLDREGLTQVCEHIGMEKMCEEVVSQLFEKLDVDHDGRIHFSEFLHLFRTGEAAPTSFVMTGVDRRGAVTGRSNVDESTENSPVHPDRHGPVSAAKLTSASPVESGIFASIDPKNTGYAAPTAIVELWDSLGINDGYSVLKELDLPANAKVNLLDLTHVLEDTLQSSSDPELTQVAFLSVSHNLKFLRRTVHQLRLERDYLIEDVADANSRAMLIAQEVDENQARLEQKTQENLLNTGKKYQDQMRRLKEELENEHDQWNEQFLKLKRSLQEEATARQEAELRHREQLMEMEKEIQDLVKEKQSLEKRLTEVDRRDQEHLMEAMSRPNSGSRSSSSSSEMSLEERCQTLTIDLERCQATNKQLQDRNDELNATVEQLKKSQLCSTLLLGSCEQEAEVISGEDRQWLDADKRQATGEDAHSSVTRCHRRNGSWLSDYLNVSPPTDRQGNPSLLAPGHTLVASCDTGMVEDDESTKEPALLLTADGFPDGANDEWSDEDEHLDEYLSYWPPPTSASKRIIANYLDGTHANRPGSTSPPAECNESVTSDRPLANTVVEGIVGPRENLGGGSVTAQVEDEVEPLDEEAVLHSPSPVASFPKLSPDSGFDDLRCSASTPFRLSMLEGRQSDRCKEEETMGGRQPPAGMASGFKAECCRERLDEIGRLRVAYGEEVTTVERLCQTVLEEERRRWTSLLLRVQLHQEELHADEEGVASACQTDGELWGKEQGTGRREECELHVGTRAQSTRRHLRRGLAFEKSDHPKECFIIGDSDCDDSGNDSRNRCGRRCRRWRASGRSSVDSRRPQDDGRLCCSATPTEAHQNVLGASTSLDSDSLEEGGSSQPPRRSGETTTVERRSDHNGQHHHVGELSQNDGPPADEEMRSEAPQDFCFARMDRSSCVIDVAMLHAINQHVRQQEQRCRHLEAAMATKTHRAQTELRDSRRSYENELRRLTLLLAKTRELLREHAVRMKEQSELLFQSDLIVKELYAENAKLVTGLHSLEEKYQLTENANVSLQQQYLTLSLLLNNMCSSVSAT